MSWTCDICGIQGQYQTTDASKCAVSARVTIVQAYDVNARHNTLAQKHKITGCGLVLLFDHVEIGFANICNMYAMLDSLGTWTDWVWTCFTVGWVVGTGFITASSTFST